eukprot:11185400-Ditylum_brightwellii.AAC.1
MSKRQPCVETLTFGAKFTVLKRGVEEAVGLRHHLKEHVAINVMRICKIDSADMFADPFTNHMDGA